MSHLTPSTFPLSECLGIFIGVVAWDLLTEGQLEVTKALLISIPTSLAWFAVRCWRSKHHNNRK